MFGLSCSYQCLQFCSIFLLLHMGNWVCPSQCQALVDTADFWGHLQSSTAGWSCSWQWLEQTFLGNLLVTELQIFFLKSMTWVWKKKCQSQYGWQFSTVYRSRLLLLTKPVMRWNCSFSFSFYTILLLRKWWCQQIALGLCSRECCSCHMTLMY